MANVAALMNIIAKMREQDMERAQVPPGVSQPMPDGPPPVEEGEASGMVIPDQGDLNTGESQMMGLQQGSIPPVDPSITSTPFARTAEPGEAAGITAADRDPTVVLPPEGTAEAEALNRWLRSLGQ